MHNPGKKVERERVENEKRLLDVSPGRKKEELEVYSKCTQRIRFLNKKETTKREEEGNTIRPLRGRFASYAEL